jgi:hypothetical protein
MGASFALDKRRKLNKYAPPIPFLVLFLVGWLPLFFDEADYSGWPRLSIIVGTALGLSLLYVLTAYWIIHLRKSKPGPIFSSAIIACCVGISSGTLAQAVHDTWVDLRRDDWVELETHYELLPYEVRESDVLYTLNLDPHASDGLEPIRVSNEGPLIWPMERHASEGKTLWWWGFRCKLRNRSIHLLTNIRFDLSVAYAVPGSDAADAQTVHHVTIDRLAPNDEVQFLLGSTDPSHEIFVYKPAATAANVGQNPRHEILPLRTVPTGAVWDIPKYWMLLGPKES